MCSPSPPTLNPVAPCPCPPTCHPSPLHSPPAPWGWEDALGYNGVPGIQAPPHAHPDPWQALFPMVKRGVPCPWRLFMVPRQRWRGQRGQVEQHPRGQPWFRDRIWLSPCVLLPRGCDKGPGARSRQELSSPCVSVRAGMCCGCRMHSLIHLIWASSDNSHMGWHLDPIPLLSVGAGETLVVQTSQGSQGLWGSYIGQRKGLCI